MEIQYRIPKINMPDREQIKTGLIVLLVGIFFFLIAAYSTSCPSCKKWFVRQIDRYDITGRERHIETRTYYREERDSNGNTTRIPYTEWVNVETTYYHNWCHCSSCDYRWEDDTSSRREW